MGDKMGLVSLTRFSLIVCILADADLDRFGDRRVKSFAARPALALTSVLLSLQLLSEL